MAKNLYKHTLSRGGYDLLDEKILKEKRKILEASGDLDSIPEPPSRHERWKRARQKQGGEYTSEEARVVAEKIVRNILFPLAFMLHSLSFEAIGKYLKILG